MAFVHGGQAQNFTTNVIAVTLAGTVAGHHVVGLVLWGDVTTNLTSVTNSTALFKNPVRGTNCSGALFTVENIAGGSLTLTANFSASPAFVSIMAIEISGGPVSSILDVFDLSGQANPGTGANAVASPSVTPTAGSEYIVGLTMDSNAAQTCTAGTTVAWTRWFTGVGYTMEDLTQGAAAGIIATFTGDQAFTDTLSAILAIKPAVVAGATLPPNRVLVRPYPFSAGAPRRSF
jgi:hypothetical protein